MTSHTSLQTVSIKPHSNNNPFMICDIILVVSNHVYRLHIVSLLLMYVFVLALWVVCESVSVSLECVKLQSRLKLLCYSPSVFICTSCMHILAVTVFDL